MWLSLCLICIILAFTKFFDFLSLIFIHYYCNSAQLLHIVLINQIHCLQIPDSMTSLIRFFGLQLKEHMWESLSWLWLVYPQYNIIRLFSRSLWLYTVGFFSLLEYQNRRPICLSRNWVCRKRLTRQRSCLYTRAAILVWLERCCHVWDPGLG